MNCLIEAGLPAEIALNIVAISKDYERLQLSEIIIFYARDVLRADRLYWMEEKISCPGGDLNVFTENGQEIRLEQQSVKWIDELYYFVDNDYKFDKMARPMSHSVSPSQHFTIEFN